MHLAGTLHMVHANAQLAVNEHMMTVLADAFRDIVASMPELFVTTSYDVEQEGVMMFPFCKDRIGRVMVDEHIQE